MRLLAFALLCLLPYGARAADVSLVAEGTQDRPAIILIKDMLVKGDDLKFVEVAGTQRTAIVFFDSRGGLVGAALTIGRTIRRRNFTTAVAAGAECASACAMAWMGGNERFMDINARIGFHAAKAAVPENAVLASLTTGVISLYYNEMGIKDPAVIDVLTTTPNESMAWLSASDSDKIGFKVFRFSDSQWAWARPYRRVLTITNLDFVPLTKDARGWVTSRPPSN